MYCQPCGHRFVNRQALSQHLHQSVQHIDDELCTRCLIPFDSHEALEQHLQRSKSHWRCPVCPSSDREDFRSSGRLRAHLKDGHPYCDSCVDMASNEQYYALIDHANEEHNRCKKCGETFINRNNLRQHRVVHKPLKYECYGCNSQFRSHSGMMFFDFKVRNKPVALVLIRNARNDDSPRSWNLWKWL